MNGLINYVQFLTFTKHMKPKRMPYGLFAQLAYSTLLYFLFLAIEQSIKNGDMFFISPVEPARLLINMYNWLSLNLNKTQRMIRKH